jgi:SAM-dependent methyltransferase
VGLRQGQVVLDVATGTGVVARAAASVVGPGGRVIASDISPRMLEQVQLGADPAGAAIETLECSAMDLPLDDGSVDVVLCQQGFPFIPDRAGAAREMHRVLRPGGVVGIAVWATGERIAPLDDYADIVRAEGLESVFGRPAGNSKLSMSTDDVERALTAGGFEAVTAEIARMDVRWPTLDDEVLGVLGTPFASVVSSLDAERRDRFFAALRVALAGPDGGPVAHPTAAVLARGVRHEGVRHRAVRTG